MTSPEYEHFIVTVQQNARISRDAAERATQATLQTLADRLSKGEARDLAASLPAELAPYLFTDTDAQAFGVDEFLRRVAEREGVDLAAAERHARAVFTALGRLVDRGEIDDMTSELPSEFGPLVAEARGRFASLLPSELFLQRVVERAAIRPEDARRATEAVLETLAERIAGGEVDDLIARLPVELHEPLRRGKEAHGGKATRMRLDEFVRRVAEREGVDLDEAREHARAVFETLRDAVGEREFLDVTAQLPEEYATVGARP